MKNILTLILSLIISISSAQWTSSTLSYPRSSPETYLNDDKIYFIGGKVTGDDYEAVKKRVDVYDISDGSWSTIDLSIERAFTFMEAVNNKLYFAGYSQISSTDQDKIEVYDLETEMFSILEFPTIYEATSLTSVGDWLIAVLGGNVDMYNTISEEWSSFTLSNNRSLAKAQGCNNKVYFAGGGSYVQGTYNTVDIYDFDTETWDTDTLEIGKNQIESACIDDDVYFFGGGVNFDEISSVFEVFNTQDESKKILEVEGLDVGYKYAVSGEYVYFGIGELENGDNALIRRINLVTSSIDTLILPNPRVGVGIIGYENTVFFAGGIISAFNYSDQVDIYNDTPSSLVEKEYSLKISVFPNPANDFLHITNSQNSKDYQIFNSMGILVQKGTTNGQIHIYNLAHGYYFLRLNDQAIHFIKN